MVDWQVTATTIYCDAVDDDVTLVVYKDGTAECIGYKKKYRQPGRELARQLQVRGKQLGRRLACEGPQCRRLVQYRDGLFAGEPLRKGAAGD